MAKTVFLLNQSRRLYMIAGVRLLPTAALEFPTEIAEYPGIKLAIEDGDLAIVDAAKDPITDKDAAEKDSAARKAANGTGAGRSRSRNLPKAAQPKAEE